MLVSINLATQSSKLPDPEEAIAGRLINKGISFRPGLRFPLSGSGRQLSSKERLGPL
jgi:hypothetical protein